MRGRVGRGSPPREFPLAAHGTSDARCSDLLGTLDPVRVHLFPAPLLRVVPQLLGR